MHAYVSRMRSRKKLIQKGMLLSRENFGNIFKQDQLATLMQTKIEVKDIKSIHAVKDFDELKGDQGELQEKHKLTDVE